MVIVLVNGEGWAAYDIQLHFENTFSLMRFVIVGDLVLSWTILKMWLLSLSLSLFCVGFCPGSVHQKCGFIDRSICDTWTCSLIRGEFVPLLPCLMLGSIMSTMYNSQARCHHHCYLKPSSNTMLVEI